MYGAFVVGTCLQLHLGRADGLIDLDLEVQIQAVAASKIDILACRAQQG